MYFSATNLNLCAMISSSVNAVLKTVDVYILVVMATSKRIYICIRISVISAQVYTTFINECKSYREKQHTSQCMLTHQILMRTLMWIPHQNPHPSNVNVKSALQFIVNYGTYSFCHGFQICDEGSRANLLSQGEITHTSTPCNHDNRIETSILYTAKFMLQSYFFHDSITL